MDESSAATNTWFTLNTAHGKYICRAAKTKGDVRATLISGGTLDVAEAFELFTPLQSVPGNTPGKMGIAKDAFVTPLDVNAAPAVTSFNLTGARVTFFHDMEDTDKDVYTKLVAMGSEMANAWRTARTGIVTPKITFA